jgi:hypothetical protein
MAGRHPYNACRVLDNPYPAQWSKNIQQVARSHVADELSKSSKEAEVMRIHLRHPVGKLGNINIKGGERKLTKSYFDIIEPHCPGFTPRSFRALLSI